MSLNLLRARRETMRRDILTVLNVSRPTDVNESLMVGVIRGEYSDVTIVELRRETDYLRDRGLTTIRETPEGTWIVGLTRHGVDVIEGTIPCEPGIAAFNREG